MIGYKKIEITDGEKTPDELKRHERNGIILSNVESMDYFLANHYHVETYNNVQSCVNVFNMYIKAAHVMAITGDIKGFKIEENNIKQFLEKLTLTMTQLEKETKEVAAEDNKTLN